ncbi:MAG: polysaccharide deacetylase family protein [Rhizomicrobium sp.]|jgi:peptidoglycan/xylan/chitin deacetylase (PgdA/CDA1 family)
MRRALFSAGIALALSCGAAFAQSAGSAADNRLAYFQTKNIFHSGLRETHTVALTFDDGPNANTPAVLDELKANGVKATFFIVGRMAKAYPQVLARIAAEGHLLANHSATHPLLGRKFVDHPELLLDQIRQVDDEISPLMPAGAKFYFRAPYGSWRAPHAAALNADPVLKKYVGPIYWDEGGDVEMSSDGYILSAADWSCWHRKWDADTCAKGYLREIRRNDGGVVLMHCIHSQSAALVANVIPALQQEGYTFVRIDQVPAYQKYETPPAEQAAPVVATAGDAGAGVATAAR